MAEKKYNTNIKNVSGAKVLKISTMKCEDYEPSKVCVEIGQKILKNQLIAKSFKGSPNIFSSASGKVSSIKTEELYENEVHTYVEIENDFNEEEFVFENIKDFSKKSVIERIEYFFLTNENEIQIKNLLSYNCKNVLINLCNFDNCDFNFTSGIVKFSNEIIKVAIILKRVLNAERILIAVNKKDELSCDYLEEALKNANCKDIYLREIGKVKDESAIVYKSFKIKANQILNQIKSNFAKKIKTPVLTKDINQILQIYTLNNVLAIYNAIFKNIPPTENLVNISGSSIKNSGTYIVKNGTLLKDIVVNCEGYFHSIEEVEDFKTMAQAALVDQMKIKEDIKNKELKDKKSENKALLKTKKAEADNIIFSKLKDFHKRYLLCLNCIKIDNSKNGNTINYLNWVCNDKLKSIYFLSNGDCKKIDKKAKI